MMMMMQPRTDPSKLRRLSVAFAQWRTHCREIAVRSMREGLHLHCSYVLSFSGLLILSRSPRFLSLIVSCCMKGKDNESHASHLLRIPCKYPQPSRQRALHVGRRKPAPRSQGSLRPDRNRVCLLHLPWTQKIILQNITPTSSTAISKFPAVFNFFLFFRNDASKDAKRRLFSLGNHAAVQALDPQRTIILNY